MGEHHADQRADRERQYDRQAAQASFQSRANLRAGALARADQAASAHIVVHDRLRPCLDDWAGSASSSRESARLRVLRSWGLGRCQA
ncbi:MAG: hypothetical protein OJF61_000696 [Rhodanobacteraceae bacterium]|nr:MAG: hypothetical protein OJF61_000696 [Rhodanobacteraceae bacterium]